MKINKYNIGETVILKRRWFLGFRNYVLCEVVFGMFDEEESEWKYTLKVGNQFKRFCMWESDIDREQP